MWQPLWAPMTIASCGQSGECQCVVPFWSRLAIARLARRCSCHTGPGRGSESSVSMCNCQNGHNWQLPVWGQSGQNLLCRFHITCWQKRAKNTGNHMEPSKKSFFVPKMIYFPNWNKDLKMGTSYFPYNIKEPKTQGTTWDHLKMHFWKWFISLSGLKILKWEPSKFLITLKHNGAKNNRNHMEPSKKYFFSQNLFVSPSGLNLKMGTS